MSETTSQPNESGAGQANGVAPSLNILTQYIRDLSFESPKAPGILRNQTKAPAINIGVNVTANPVEDSQTDFDVRLTLNAKAGETLRLVLKNDDFFIHTFTIDELDVDVTIGPRGEKILKLTPANKGTFEYRCTIPGHESMEGTLTVG